MGLSLLHQRTPLRDHSGHHPESLLLEKVARRRDDTSLAAFLKTQTAQERVQAVHDLAGGHPRIYLLFAHLLSQENLDELVTPFLTLLDELTPFYQSRMQILSHQQRKIVEFLCSVRGATPVKEIAAQNLITSQTASGQLDKLEEMAYVRKTSVGREALYELREPLLRMVIEVKRGRGEPIRLIVDFLRRWYNRRERQERLSFASLEYPLTHTYLTASLDLKHAIRDVPNLERAQHFSSEFATCLETEQFDRACELAAEIIERKGTACEFDDWFQYAYCLSRANRDAEALSIWNDMVELAPDNPSGWSGRGIALENLGDTVAALESYDKAVALDPNDSTLWIFRGNILGNVGNDAAALVSYDKALTLAPNDPTLWFIRGHTLGNLGEHNAAVASYDQAIALDPTNADAWRYRGIALWNLGSYKEVLSSYDNALALKPDHPGLWNNRGVTLGQLDDMPGALASFEKALLLDPGIAQLWTNCGTVLYTLHEYKRALATFDRAIEIDPEDAPVWFHRAEAQLALANWEECFKSIERGFGLLPEKDLSLGRPAELCRLLLQQRNFRDEIKQLARLYAHQDVLGFLGQGVTESIPAVLESRVSQSLADDWQEAWEMVQGEGAELAIPVRILASAVEWKKTRSVRALLALPIEERRILEGLLPTREENDAS